MYNRLLSACLVSARGILIAIIIITICRATATAYIPPKYITQA